MLILFLKLLFNPKSFVFKGNFRNSYFTQNLSQRILYCQIFVHDAYWTIHFPPSLYPFGITITIRIEMHDMCFHILFYQSLNHSRTIAHVTQFTTYFLIYICRSKLVFTFILFFYASDCIHRRHYRLHFWLYR